MSDIPPNDEDIIKIDREKFKKSMAERESHKQIIEKDFIPNYFPTYRINSKYYPLPIIITVVCAGFLAFATYVLAGLTDIEGGYVSEAEYGPIAGLINGLIFTGVAVVWAFIIVYIIKKKGIDILKYVFGGSFAFIGFFLTIFFGTIILFLIFSSIENSIGASAQLFNTYMLSVNIFLPIGVGIFTFLLIYKYFTTESYGTKNFIVVYIGLLIGALMGVIMPIWTTLAILIGVSLWDIFAVKSNRGPIKEMIELASVAHGEEEFSDEEIKERIQSGEMIYDTSMLEIGIGDLAFYSMLTSAALIITGNLFVMILTSIAIIIGTGITISGLKHNKILPGLPISIFLGIGTMLISWYIFSLIPL